MIMRVLLLSILFLAGLIGVKVYSDAEVKKGSDGKIFILELVIVGIAVYFNLLLAIMWRIGDITDFANMMKRLMNGGFFGLYQNGGIVYPPLFQYLFFVIAKILQWMGIPFDSRLRIFTMSVKLPCILCVFIMAWMIWQTVRKYAAKEHESVVLYLCLLNPGYLLITAVVCQVDALYTCLMLLTVYLIINQKLKWSYFAFAGAILLKFQAVFLTPVIAFAVINEVCLKNFSWKRFFGELLAGLSAIACIALSYIPFVYDFKTGNWTNGGFSQNFSSTIVGFGKASQNAYNFWTLVGYNEIPISTYFGPFTCDTWNKIFIVLLVALCSFLFWKKRSDRSIYPMLAALLVTGTYCFAVKMMSRYWYPALVFLFLGYALRPTKKRLFCSALIAVVFFLETAFDYLIYPWTVYHRGLIAPYLVSFLVVVCFGVLVYVIWSEPDSRE